MAIPEAQLQTWQKPGPTAQFTPTYQTVRDVLQSSNAPFHNRGYTIFLQGSYANDTNIYGDSDVDVVIRLDDVHYADLSQLSDEDRANYNAIRTPATYDLPDFKKDVVSWLIKNYPSSVVPGNKAVFLKGNGSSRRDADVIVCAKLYRYLRFKSWADQRSEEGICFFAGDGTRIDNFPKQHSANCTTRHQATASWFKPTVRIFKNVRNKLLSDRAIAGGLAPSYYLEGLLYNVPAGRFGGSEQQNFKDVLDWLNATTDKSKFVCANDLYYLLNDYSPVTWRAASCSTFLAAATKLWNDW